jgi:undecaprenyl-diphosphatase
MAAIIALQKIFQEVPIPVVSDLLHLNYTLFQAINAPAGSHPLFDQLMIFCANWLIFFWPLLLLCVWGIPISWSRRTVEPGESLVLQERRSLVLWVAFACLLAYGLNLLLEHFIFEPRPFISHKVHLLVAHAADASFPSDHTAWSFAVFGMLLFALFFLFGARRRTIIHGKKLFSLVLLLMFAFVIACIIGVARIYVGVHYPGDIVGGAIDGILAACIVTVVRWRLRRPTDAVLRFAQTMRVA